ncbi:MAG: DNA polymerase III subunit gamma/tau [Formosimonas sp.]
MSLFDDDDLPQTHSHVLARKWRPRDFASLVGQAHVVKALTHALTEKRLHHAYLFTGTRGVGKTTIARILAKSLNCETGITATPCNVCQACVDIDAGRFIDLLEIDAASNTGVDDMRQLIENAVYMPTAGRYKVYLIDEVHMLSKSAFNALLKTLEEPPAHVLFILATTDPQKILPTVLSRCLQFNLKQMPPADIVAHLTHILTAEQVAFEPAALHMLAKGAQGSMRDALSLTDQAIAFSLSNITLPAVQDMLGTTDGAQIEAILRALLAKDGAKLVELAQQMSERSTSFYDATLELAQALYRISLAQVVPNARPDDYQLAALVAELAPQMGADEVQLYYSIVTASREQLHLAPDAQAGFTMMLLRLLAFAPVKAETAPAKK